MTAATHALPRGRRQARGGASMTWGCWVMLVGAYGLGALVSLVSVRGRR